MLALGSKADTPEFLPLFRRARDRITPDRLKFCVRAKAQFPSCFQSDFPRPALTPKISRFPFTANQQHLPRILSHAEGRFAIVTNVEVGSGGRETSQHSSWDADERGLADGEAVWSWRPDAGVKFAKTRSASRG